MTGSGRSARTLVASGRFLCLVVAATGCQVAGVPVPAPEAPSGEPVVAVGRIEAAEQLEAQQTFRQAERSFAANRFLETLRFTDDILTRWPESDVSGAALLLGARAEAALGAVERADAAAEEYIALLRPGDPRATEVRFFQASVLVGQPAIRLDRLLRIGASATAAETARARSEAEALLDSLRLSELEVIVDAAPSGGAASAPVYTRLTMELLSIGEVERASGFARAAIDAGVSGADRDLLEGVLRGDMPPGLLPVRAFTIATVLPTGGPPALAEYAALVAEGVEVAVATVLGDDYTVSVIARDDQADPIVSAQIVGELEAEGVAGVIGFLQDDQLLAGAAARTTGVPLISPTARSAAFAGAAAYSLEGADPEAAMAIARYSADRAHQRVAMVFPDTPVAAEEADAFEALALSLGIPIVGRFTYQAGATDFEAPLELAQNALRAAEIAALGLTEEDTLFVEMLEPVGLFMPIPPEDVEFVAPQFAHHGLDTLAIEVMGTSGWTDPQALEDVDRRLVSGVVATSPLSSGPGSPGYARFQQAYETYFQRSLVSSTPAVGYDAALLLLEALRPGRIRPEQVFDAFQGLSGVEGATGVLSVVDDRVVRLTRVVRFENGRLVPLATG